jgi:hypothetical protein
MNNSTTKIKTFCVTTFLLCVSAIINADSSPLIFNDTSTNNYILKGRICDSTLKQGLSSASIWIKSKMSCTSDNDGYFEFKLPQKYRSKNFIVHVALVMYDPNDIKVKNRKATKTADFMIFLKKKNTDPNALIQICQNKLILLEFC